MCFIVSSFRDMLTLNRRYGQGLKKNKKTIAMFSLPQAGELLIHHHPSSHEAEKKKATEQDKGQLKILCGHFYYYFITFSITVFLHLHLSAAHLLNVKLLEI